MGSLEMRMITFVLALGALLPCGLARGSLSEPYLISGKGNNAFAFPDYALPTSSGYFTVDPLSSARLFYAFYEASEPAAQISETPIILWLQGGPGCSSMIGNFYELGPWRTASDLQLHKNEFSWNKRFGLLFIDSPVGTGFSIAEKDEDIPTDQEQVAAQLYIALTSFFSLEPLLQSRPFFVAGESYAGKYVPALGYYYFMKQKLSLSVDIELQESKEVSPKAAPFRLDGLIIGNGLTDPKVQVQSHADTAFSFGIIDMQQRGEAQEKAKEIVKLVEEEDWHSAYNARTKLLNWIQHVGGLATVLDIRRRVPYHCGADGVEFLKEFLGLNSVKTALKAEEQIVWVPCSSRVGRIMANDTMKSVKWMIDELLQHNVPILLYQGQFDIKDGVASSEDWMRTLSWKGQEAFSSTKRRLWQVGNVLAGYWRSYEALTHVVVVGAGHEVPADQGLHSQKMIEEWIQERLIQLGLSKISSE
ncbi:hypothetical protein O6H91_03G052900 [Diphasiastrum complanatum]|uniref:Uncharacterized protein n=1 Tax=Diphasiastrum complanatum TaxID=34168 RepID=A0ACC2E642_DIPCM|nr:hypothetical protein O6H91_03G052900 [Diphasiastrum complanatum]